MGYDLKMNGNICGSESIVVDIISVMGKCITIGLGFYNFYLYHLVNYFFL